MSDTVHAIEPDTVRAQGRATQAQEQRNTGDMSYFRQWANAPRAAGFLLGSFPIALFGFIVTITLVSTGAALAVFGIGLVILQFALVTARGLGAGWRAWVVRADGRDIPAPTPLPVTASESGWLGRLTRPLTIASDWRALAHQIVSFLLMLVTWVIALTWILVGVTGVLYGALIRIIPQSPDNVGLSELIWGSKLTIDPVTSDTVLYGVLGLILILTLPVVFHGLVALHWHVARALLGESESEALRREVASLEQARGAAASAEHRTLGQLERDLHDGPQQRLVRLQMDLATAERRLGDDPEAAARLLGEARGTAQETLDELRALSRGFAPPILGDRGLAAALAALAARGPLPIDLSVDTTAALAPELERNLYFVAAELVTNAAKHSGADRVVVHLRDGGRPGTVELEVADSGTGGIREVSGHGIAGLTERLRGIGGTLRVDSPVGGPSSVVATVPVSLGE